MGQCSLDRHRGRINRALSSHVTLPPLLHAYIHKANMSWQAYVDNQLVGQGTVTRAAICGHDGSIWAKSADFALEAPEAAKIAVSFNADSLPMDGVTVGGTRYMYLSGTDELMRARKGKAGLHIAKTTQAVIIAMYEEPITGQACAGTVENLQSYLKDMNY